MTSTQNTTTYSIKMENEYHYADYHVNATSEQEARDKMRTVAEKGDLAETADEEYEMARQDDRYDPDRRDYTYHITDVKPADEHDQQANDAPHMISSGGLGPVRKMSDGASM
jgi:hypothetical protein